MLRQFASVLMAMRPPYRADTWAGVKYVTLNAVLLR